MGTTSAWKGVHYREYDAATRHQFVLGIRDGTADIAAFKRWLGQDYIYVRQFVPFVASVLLKAWRQSDVGTDMEVILGGMTSLSTELSWFKEEACKWDVNLDSVVPQKANIEYCRFLESLTLPEVEFTVAITAFWAIETVYQESFAHCLESDSNIPEELIETCQRWGSQEFGQYCQSLQKIADRCLEKASDDVLRKAEEVFIAVLEHEVSFWDMSSGET